MFCITKWRKKIWPEKKYEDTWELIHMKEILLANEGEVPKLYRFRLWDDYGIVAYGYSTKKGDETPLNHYMYTHSCTDIQYKNEDGKYY